MMQELVDNKLIENIDEIIEELLSDYIEKNLTEV